MPMRENADMFDEITRLGWQFTANLSSGIGSLSDGDTVVTERGSNVWVILQKCCTRIAGLPLADDEWYESMYGNEAPGRRYA